MEGLTLNKELTSRLAQIDAKLAEHANKLELILVDLEEHAKELRNKGTAPVELANVENMIERMKRQRDRIRLGG